PAARRDCHRDWPLADRDIGRVLGPGAHVDRRHRIAALFVTNAVLPSGVTATPKGFEPTAMSVGFLVRVFTSMVDTESLAWLAMKAVLLSGVNATTAGSRPTGMSVGSLVLVFMSMVDTLPLLLLVT